MADAGGNEAARTAGWKLLLALFCLTSIVEAYGVAQMFAFMPRYLEKLGVATADLPGWTGTLSSVAFLIGLPLVPLWGVWADKYSRKAVIVRSALVEAVVFLGVALAQTPTQLGVSIALAGFQLGNTGVMLAALREVVPLNRLGLTT